MKSLHISNTVIVVLSILAICGFMISVTEVPAAAAEGAAVLGHKVKDIDGNEIELAQYKGKVVMIVNVASKCGLTPQYTDLVTLHKKYRDRDFAILAFPANNFAGQEPGTNEEIKQFCQLNYNVEFDLFEKISVKGEDIAPLYKQLTSNEENSTFGGDIKWNFDKFLVGRDGRVVARFEPMVKPTAGEIISVIEAELAR